MPLLGRRSAALIVEQRGCECERSWLNRRSLRRGVTQWPVSRRRREISVRIALGAEAHRVWWAIAGATLRQLSIGLVLDTAGAVAVATVLPALLVGTGRPSPLIFAGVALLLLATGVAASAIPARRAMRLDPVSALQAE